MTAESLLHVARVPGTIARRPIGPGTPQQLFDHPAVDIAAIIVPRVDDQPAAVVFSIEIAGEAVDILARHGAQMQIADLAVARLFDGVASAFLPIAIAQPGIAA